MKAKLAIVFGVLVATVCLVVLMNASPDRKAAQAPAAPNTPQTIPAGTVAETQEAPEEPVLAAPGPLPTEEDLAAIEERIEGSIERMPALDRLKLWWVFPGQQMSDDDYEKARGLYLRFLDNFARIETAQFRVEWYNILKDGSQELSLVDDVVWSPPMFSTERTRQEPGKEPVKMCAVSNGKKVSLWKDGRKTYTGGARNWGLWGDYVFRIERTTIREAHPCFLNAYTHCDIDDGATGYSRLWRENGGEARFDTATGLLTEQRGTDGGGSTYTYQNGNGRWFPLEVVETFTEAQDSGMGADVRRIRQVFSRVVLNEPLDEALFDLNNPG